MTKYRDKILAMFLHIIPHWIMYQTVLPGHTVYAAACTCTRVIPHMRIRTRDSGCIVHAAATARTALRSSPSRLLRLCRSFWSGIYARFDGKRQRNSDATQDNFWFTASSPELSPAVHRAEIRPAPHFRNGNPPPCPDPPTRRRDSVSSNVRSTELEKKKKKERERERRVCSEIGCDRKS